MLPLVILTITFAYSLLHAFILLLVLPLILYFLWFVILMWAPVLCLSPYSLLYSFASLRFTFLGFWPSLYDYGLFWNHTISVHNSILPVLTALLSAVHSYAIRTRLTILRVKYHAILCNCLSVHVHTLIYRFTSLLSITAGFIYKFQLLPQGFNGPLLCFNSINCYIILSIIGSRCPSMVLCHCARL